MWIHWGLWTYESRSPNSAFAGKGRPESKTTLQVHSLHLQSCHSGASPCPSSRCFCLGPICSPVSQFVTKHFGSPYALTNGLWWRSSRSSYTLLWTPFYAGSLIINSVHPQLFASMFFTLLFPRKFMSCFDLVATHSLFPNSLRLLHWKRLLGVISKLHVTLHLTSSQSHWLQL